MKKLVITLLLILIPSVAMHVATAADIIGCCSKTDAYDNLANAVSSASSNGKIIVISNNQVLTRNLIVPASVSVNVAKGGLITHGPYNVTLRGPFSAGLYPVFSGTGAVVFEAGSLQDIYPEWWGAKADGTTNCTGAIQSAINSGNSIKFSGGTYLTDTIRLKANYKFSGSGIGMTTIKQNRTTGASYGTLFLDSGSSSATRDNIILSDFTIDGSVAAKGFSEHEPLVSLHGVRNVIVERVKFLGFRGDGLYIGSSPTANVERHNYNVLVRDSIFDGVNNDNRNGITIIDGVDVTIQNSSFVNCSRATMPGAIDIEPDANVFHVIRNIKIQGNKFYNNKGSNGSISVYFPNVPYGISPTGFLFEGNTIDNTTLAGDAGFFFVHEGDADTTRKHNAKIVNNALVKTARGFRIFGMNAVTLTGNVFDETLYEPLVGYLGTSKNMNIQVIANTFKKIATKSGSGVSVFSIDHLLLEKNTFIDCGKADGTYGIAIDFNKGTSSYVSLIDNRFESPNAKTTIAIQKESSHSFSPATNTSRNNVLLDAVKGNEFQSR